MKIHKLSFSSLPSIVFAHAYSCKDYDAAFPVQKNFIEISFQTEGSLLLTRKGSTEESVIPQGAVMVSVRTEEEHIKSRGLQSHVTVGFAVELSEEEDVVLPNWFLPKNGEQYQALILRIIEEFTLAGKTTISLVSMILHLVTKIADEYENQQEREIKYSEIRYVEQAKRYIVEHLNEKLYVENVAQATHLSVGYLSNLFKRITGQTMVEYFNMTRLRRIKELMETKGLTVKEASLLYGFSDENYVSRLYRKYFNATITGR